MRLQEELLTVTLKPGPAMDVLADFRFEGRDRSELTLDFPEDDRTVYRDFRVTLPGDGPGKLLSSRRERAPDSHVFDFGVGLYPVRYVTKVPRGGDKLRVQVGYSAELPHYYREGSKGEAPAGHVVHYILRTGGTWRGTLDDLTVQVEPGPYPCSALKPTARSIQGACSADGIWRHQMRGAKLTADLELVLDGADLQP